MEKIEAKGRHYGLTVGELRAFIEGKPDEAPILLEDGICVNATECEVVAFVDGELRIA